MSISQNVISLDERQISYLGVGDGYYGDVGLELIRVKGSAPTPLSGYTCNHYFHGSDLEYTFLDCYKRDVIPEKELCCRFERDVIKKNWNSSGNFPSYACNSFEIVFHTPYKMGEIKNLGEDLNKRYKVKVTEGKGDGHFIIENMEKDKVLMLINIFPNNGGCGVNFIKKL